MARRTKEEALETREQLLDAAERVFRERGVGHASMAEVADAAGVTRGAVYHHFESKAELFQALMARAEMPIDTAFEDFENQDIADPLALFRQQGLQALAASDELARKSRTFSKSSSCAASTPTSLRPSACSMSRIAFNAWESARPSSIRRSPKGQLPADTDTHMAAHGAFAFVGGLMRDWVEAPDTLI